MNNVELFKEGAEIEGRDAYEVVLELEKYYREHTDGSVWLENSGVAVS